MGKKSGFNKMLFLLLLKPLYVVFDKILCANLPKFSLNFWEIFSFIFCLFLGNESKWGLLILL